MIIIHFNDAFHAETRAFAAAVIGYENGCFNMIYTRKTGHYGIRFYSETGELKNELKNLEQANSVILHGAFLNEGMYHLISSRKDDPTAFLNLVGLSDDEAKRREKGSFEIFSNGWYLQTSDGVKTLYRKDGSIAQSKFDAVKVFDKGYAVQFVKAPIKWWFRYTANGHLIGPVLAPQFFGDGNRLDKEGRLVDFNDNILEEGPFVLVQHFVNGRFVLQDKNGGKALYEPDGTRNGAMGDDDVVFLPDGRFIGHENKRVMHLYRADGIIEQPNIWRYQIAGSYYLLCSEDNSGVLYDDKSVSYGSGFGLIKEGGGFALFENEEGGLELFNRSGRVLRLARH